jgi:hypothetical protein
MAMSARSISDTNGAIPWQDREYFDGIIRLRCASPRMIMLELTAARSLCALRLDLDVDRNRLADAGDGLGGRSKH